MKPPHDNQQSDNNCKHKEPGMLSYEPSIICQQPQQQFKQQFRQQQFQSIPGDSYNQQSSGSVVPLSIETIEHCDPTIGASSSAASAAVASSGYTYDYWTTDSFYDRKDLADDVKSNRSAMTNKSTRQVFDLLAKILPIGVFLLLVSLMVHFVSNVEAYEPIQSISRLICIILAMTVIPLSVVFILKTICDRKDNSCWSCDEYETDYLSPIRFNLDNSSSGSRSIGPQGSLYKHHHHQQRIAPGQSEMYNEYYPMKEIPLN